MKCDWGVGVVARNILFYPQAQRLEFATYHGMSESKPPALHVAEIRKNYKGKLHVTTLVRRTFREGKKVRHETISNISGLPQDLIESIKLRFKTGLPLTDAGEEFTIERTLPHGNVAAVLGTMKKLGMEKLLAHRPCRERSWFSP